jgi:two-component system LytT family response regulator
MLELIDNRPSVIFTTAFDEYALKAFEAHAIDYLLKPVVKERFAKAIEKWKNSVPSKAVTDLSPILENNVYEGYQHRIVVKDNGLIRIIPANEIHYLEADDDYVRIVTKGGTYLKKSTLAHLEQTLDPQQFVRVHRSYLIPVSQLLRIEPYEKESHIALLQCGAKVTVSKTGMAKLKGLLGW